MGCGKSTQDVNQTLESVWFSTRTGSGDDLPEERILEVKSIKAQLEALAILKQSGHNKNLFSIKEVGDGLEESPYSTMLLQGSLKAR